MRKSRAMLILKVVLAALAVAAALLFLLVWAYQEYGIYKFDPTRMEPAEVGLPGVRVVRFRSEDGAEVSAWIAPPRAAMPVLLSFFGGFACVGPSAGRLKPLVDQGHGLAMLVYRGSSGDGGLPSEDNFARDARALYDQLDALLGQAVPADRRVIHGFSLGSSVAAGLAAERPAAGLILEASFDRCCRWYSMRLFRLPMCLLMWRERHDVIDKLAGVAVPKLFLHGAKDTAIPIDWAQKLYAAAVGEKRFVTYEQGDHADLVEHGALTEIAAFVAALPRTGR